MRKVLIIGLLVLLVLSVFVAPCYAGKGNPTTSRQGNETGKALQNGPNGPNYATPTPTPTTAPVIIYQPINVSPGGGTTKHCYG